MRNKCPQHIAPPGGVESNPHVKRDEENHAARPVVVVLRPPHCLYYLLDGVNGGMTGSQTVLLRRQVTRRDDRLGQSDTQKFFQHFTGRVKHAQGTV